MQILGQKNCEKHTLLKAGYEFTKQAGDLVINISYLPSSSSSFLSTVLPSSFLIYFIHIEYTRHIKNFIFVMSY